MHYILAPPCNLRNEDRHHARTRFPGEHSGWRLHTYTVVAGSGSAAVRLVLDDLSWKQMLQCFRSRHGHLQPVVKLVYASSYLMGDAGGGGDPIEALALYPQGCYRREVSWKAVDRQ